MMPSDVADTKRPATPYLHYPDLPFSWGGASHECQVCSSHTGASRHGRTWYTDHSLPRPPSGSFRAEDSAFPEPHRVCFAPARETISLFGPDGWFTQTAIGFVLHHEGR